MIITFDDGPSEHTLEILEILGPRAPLATFFMVGEQVDAHPQIARAVWESGAEIGNHTHTHPKLDELDVSEILWEFEQMAARLAALEIPTPKVYRPPYGRSSPAIRQIVGQTLGMAERLWDVDPRDWALPGVDAIEARILSAGAEQTVLLHDGGGDRSQTVEALRRVLYA